MNLKPKIMKKNIWKIVYLVVCIIVFIIAINNISKCSKEISEENNEQTITANAREQIIDSLKVIYIQEKDSALKRLILSHEKELIKIKKQGVNVKTIYITQIEAYNNDTLNQTSGCDSIISSADFIITNLEEQIDIYNDITGKQSERILLKDSINAILNIQLQSCAEQNKNFKEVIRKQNNWWNRNKLGIGFGSGIIITTAALYGITRLLR